MKRNIIEIDRDLCNGCGLCASACHEGAIQMIDGKAALIHDKYCDGLGDCLPACPTNAIKMIEREADPYDDDAVKELQRKKAEEAKIKPIPCGCPGTMAKKIEKNSAPVQLKSSQCASSENPKSQLGQWPVQIKLVNPQADYLDGADILIAADCTAYAYANFHEEFIKGRITLIGCPKLDDNKYYEEKLTEIFSGNDIKSITVVRMEVPCCSGIIASVKQAILCSQKIVPYSEITISVDGNRI
ncbi:4Fe-4S binding domain-containing protein [Peptoclostridium litorale DSM 5388]|uniref:4Fe-4S domain binding protein n=1 Tax=Peptoclostridium litorale DSM 5388 TaxID=1121324 RepID=A0A069RCP8_PEPLI|nr:4Fe-4S binding protein [Peptoclostridium litorale]KDR94834.1 4Fe-4S domain binding protein [Peptoclostridium litorale DSM 5388]SIN93707.1 4Fe-4S binding domain-containing protein [Peptoclostridium litorale DSM 5388]